MKIIHRLFVALVACVTAASARAEDIILASPLVPYDKVGTASEDVRKDCDWNATMPSYLAKESDGRV